MPSSVPDPMEPPFPPRRISFFWFTKACCCSWLIIMSCFVVFVTALATIGGLNRVAADICAQPEIVGNSSALSCAAALQCYVDCNDQYDIITSMKMRQCLIGDADISGGNPSVEIDSQCTHDAATRAYNLARRYRNSTVDVEQARALMIAEIGAANGRRMATTEQKQQLDAEAVEDAASATRILVRAVAAAALGGDFTDVLRAPEPHSRRRALNELSASQALADAYVTTAVAVAVALIAAGRLSIIFGWLAFLAFVALIPPCVGLYSLGNSPPRCCQPPTHVDRMHKASMRCACHCSYLWGIVVLLLGGLAVTKFQVLARRFSESHCVAGNNRNHCVSAEGVPRLWGESSIAMLIVPCVMAIVAGVLPVCYAMVLSRSRAERRDAMAVDVPMHMYKLGSKELTAPKAVLQGAAPNLAMLNPVLDSQYAAQFASIGAPPAASRAPASKVEQV